MHPSFKNIFRAPVLPLCICTLLLAALSFAMTMLPALPTEEPPPMSTEEFPVSSAPAATPTPATTSSFTKPDEQTVASLGNEIPPVPSPYGRIRGKGATEHMLTVPFMDQSAYPTGCESVSAVMLLQYYGIEMDPDTFIDEYLETSEYYEKDGILYAPHPNDAFIGDPRLYSGFGCYSPVIYRALQQCLPEEFFVQEATGTTLEDLCSRYIDLGHPVLVWATMDMVPVSDGPTWHLPDSEETYTWLNNEHCLVLVGYDEENYYFNDPLAYRAPIAYSRSLVEQRYAELGMQALVVFP